MNKEIAYILNGDLYSLLEICNNDDLELLVNTIRIGKPKFLAPNNYYTNIKTDYTKYFKLIGDEIRLFGGYSIINRFRRNEGPPYDEIVIDVCKQLGVPFEQGNTAQNESNLLDIFVEQRWNSLSAEDRKKLADKAGKEALGKISDAAAISKKVAIIAFSGFGPAGWIALGINLLNPNMKITIPCVLHIAYLRRRIIEEREVTSSASSLINAATPSEMDSPLQSKALAIAAEDDEPVLSLAYIPEPSDIAAWHEIDSSDDGISRLNPLLQSVPTMMVAGEVATANYMQVITNGDKLLRTKDGVLKAITVGENGKFSGIAEVIEPSRLAAMVNVSALLNVASIILAQKHLADISKKLSEIKEAIEDIWQYLQSERHSKMTGSIHYFEQVSPSILEGELPDRVLHQIEHHEAELLQVQEHLMKDIRTKLGEVRDLKNNEWFGSSETMLAIEKRQQEIQGFYRELTLCIRARSCGWQLLCVFPGEEKGKARRRYDIEKSLEALSSSGDLLTETDALFRNNIHNLSSSWNRDTTINERKLTLLRTNEALLADVALCRTEVQKDLRAADEMLSAARKPLAMVARIEDGRITAVSAR